MSSGKRVRKKFHAVLRLTEVKECSLEEQEDGSFVVLDESGQRICGCTGESGLAVAIGFRALGITADLLSVKFAGEVPEPLQSELALSAVPCVAQQRNLQPGLP